MPSTRRTSVMLAPATNTNSTMPKANPNNPRTPSSFCGASTSTDWMNAGEATDPDAQLDAVVVLRVVDRECPARVVVGGEIEPEEQDRDDDEHHEDDAARGRIAMRALGKAHDDRGPVLSGGHGRVFATG